MNELERCIVSLAKQAESSENRDDAMKYSQAALNLAHTLDVLNKIKSANIVNEVAAIARGE